MQKREKKKKKRKKWSETNEFVFSPWAVEVVWAGYSRDAFQLITISGGAFPRHSNQTHFCFFRPLFLSVSLTFFSILNAFSCKWCDCVRSSVILFYSSAFAQALWMCWRLFRIDGERKTNKNSNECEFSLWTKINSLTKHAQFRITSS